MHAQFLFFCILLSWNNDFSSFSFHSFSRRLLICFSGNFLLLSFLVIETLVYLYLSERSFFIIINIRHQTPEVHSSCSPSYSNIKALVRGMECRKMLYFNLKSFLYKRISIFDCISIFQCMIFLSFCRWHPTYVQTDYTYKVCTCCK